MDPSLVRVPSLDKRSIADKIQRDLKLIMDMTNTIAHSVHYLNEENDGLKSIVEFLQQKVKKRDAQLKLKDKEVEVYYAASTDLQVKLDDAEQSKIQLQGQVQHLQTLNVQVLQHSTDTQSRLDTIYGQLEATRDELAGLRMQNTSLKNFISNRTNASPDHIDQASVEASNRAIMPLSPPHKPLQLPAPPPHKPLQSPAPSAVKLESPPLRPHAIPIRPPSDRLGENQPPTKQSISFKPRPSTIARGGKQIDEAFARFQQNLLANATNGRDPVRKLTPYTQALRAQSPEESPKQTLNPECVPFVPSSSTSVPKLNPFSRPFTPSGPTTSPSIPAVNDSEPNVNPNSEKLPSTTSEQKAIDPENESRTCPEASENVSKSAEPSPATVKAKAFILPHLRGVRVQSQSPSKGKTPADVSTPITTSASGKKGGSEYEDDPNEDLKARPTTPAHQPRTKAMENWLDSMEKKSRYPLAQEESSTSTTSAANKLIDLGYEEKSRYPAGKGTPSFTNVQALNGDNEANINAAFLAAFDSGMDDIQRKYGRKAKAEPGSNISEGKKFLDKEEYVAPKIVGTRVLGELLDKDSKNIILINTPRTLGIPAKFRGHWKAVSKNGRKVYVLE